MDTFTVEIPVTITDAEFDDIPFAQACWPWADVYRTTDGYCLEVNEEYGIVTGDEHNVSYGELRDAFATIINGVDDNGRRVNIANYIREYFFQAIMQGEDGSLDLGCIDTDAADVWIQIAIWGECVYS